MEQTKEPFITDVVQIGIVVPDLEAAMKMYVEEYGIGPFVIYELNPETAHSLTVGEEPVEHAFRVGIAKVGRCEWELIEPLDDRSHHAKWLAERGPGVHHVSVTTSKPYAEAKDELKAKGHIAHQGGGYKQNSFVYMSTDRDLGVITELVDAPADANYPPDAVYPPAA